MPTQKKTKRATKISTKQTPFEKIETLKKTIIDAEKSLVTAFEKAEAHAKKTLAQSQVKLTRTKAKLLKERDKYKVIVTQMKVKKTAALKTRWEKAKANVAELVGHVAQLNADHVIHKQHVKTTQQAKKQHKAKQAVIAKHEAEIIKAAKKSKKVKSSRSHNAKNNKPATTDAASQRTEPQPTTNTTDMEK